VKPLKGTYSEFNVKDQVQTVGDIGENQQYPLQERQSNTKLRIENMTKITSNKWRGKLTKW
jgi:hypothetical protein